MTRAALQLSLRGAAPGRAACRGLRWLCASAVAVVIAWLAFAAPALAAEPELAGFSISRDEDGLHLGYAVEFELSKSVEDALMKGVPLFFVAEANVYRDRWYWSDRRVAHTERVWRVAYQPLTSTYRVTFGGLSQNYASRDEALRAVSRSARWKIGEPGQLDDGGRHYVEFSYRLDTSLLPRPMQIGVSGQPDWSLAVKRTVRID